MCGRFSLTLPTEAIGRLFGVDVENAPPLRARYNIAPSQRIAAIRINDESKARELALLHWGFVPAWARDPASMNQPINARGESVEAKPMFRDAFRKRRCLIPADGFYEWKKTAAGKQPWRIERADGAPLAFAGLWDRWQGRDGAAIESCVILTTEANDAMRPFRLQMPVILRPENYAFWLQPDPEQYEAALAILKPYPSSRMDRFRVGPFVNDIDNDDKQCLDALVAEDEEVPS